jgi:hypothetical protein
MTRNFKTKLGGKPIKASSMMFFVKEKVRRGL